MGHDHSHAVDGNGGMRRLVIALAITISILIVEVIASVISGSLALLADAGHVLTDAAALLLSLTAMWFAKRPATPARTFGYRRLEVLAAAVNASALLVISAFVLVESARRFTDTPEVMSGWMIAFGIIGGIGNTISYLVLRGGAATSLNVQGAALEVLGDLLGSVAVVIAGVVIATTGFLLADPIASAVIGLIIVPRALSLLKQSIDVLLEATPRDVDLDQVREHILSEAGVIDAHDLHVWTITSGMNVLSAHVVISDDVEYEVALQQLRDCLANHFDLEHSTFQLEKQSHAHLEHGTCL